MNKNGLQLVRGKRKTQTCRFGGMLCKGPVEGRTSLLTFLAAERRRLGWGGKESGRLCDLFLSFPNICWSQYFVTRCNEIRNIHFTVTNLRTVWVRPGLYSKEGIKCCVNRAVIQLLARKHCSTDFLENISNYVFIVRLLKYYNNCKCGMINSSSS